MGVDALPLVVIQISHACSFIHRSSGDPTPRRSQHHPMAHRHIPEGSVVGIIMGRLRANMRAATRLNRAQLFLKVIEFGICLDNEIGFIEWLKHGAYTSKITRQVGEGWRPVCKLCLEDWIVSPWRLTRHDELEHTVEVQSQYKRNTQ